MHLLLIRHGQTESNVLKRLDTEPPGPPLTPEGVAQAARLAERLVDAGITLVGSSPYLRAMQTLAPLAAALGLDPLVRPGLREAPAGGMEMSGDLATIRDYRANTLRWSRGELDSSVPGGETGHAMLSRVDAVVDEVTGLGHERVALVTHGATMAAWVGVRASNVAGFWTDPPIDNTGILSLVGSPSDGWHLESWVDHDLDWLAGFQQSPR